LKSNPLDQVKSAQMADIGQGKFGRIFTCLESV
jgi:hypothetical protein